VGLSEIPTRVLQWLIGLMVNLKFAVAWLMLMATLAVYGTVFLEGAESMAFFRKPFFSFVLLVFAVALIVAVFSRYPWKKHHVGWITTHTGLVVIVLGHIMTYRGGFEGIVSLREGEATTVMEQAIPAGSLFWDLRMELPAAATTEAVTLLPDDLAADPDTEIAHGPFVVGDVEVTVERYVPSLELRTAIEPDFTPGAPYPAYRLEVKEGDLTRASWVLADESRGRMRLGDALTCRYLVVGSQAERDRILGGEAEDSDDADAGHIVLGASGVEIPVTRLLLEPVPLGDSGITARVLRRFERLRIVDNEPVEMTQGATNQAIEVELVASDGHTEKIWLFAQLSQFDLKPKEMTLPFRLSYHGPGAHDGGQLTPSSVVIVQVIPEGVTASADPSDGDAILAVTDSDGRTKTRPLVIGERFALPWLSAGLSARITDRWDRVRAKADPFCASYEPRRPALRVRIAEGDTSEVAWVVWNPQNQPTEVQLPGAGPLLLSYGPRQLGLGFRIELLDFVLETYEGIDQPKSFESFVRTSDHPGTVTTGAHDAPPTAGPSTPIPIESAEGHRVGDIVRVGTNTAFYYGTVQAVHSGPGGPPALEVERLDRPTPLRGGETVPSGNPVLGISHIYMNHPLVHRGYTFFQSSYDPETLKRSTFQVTFDPGWKTVYVGYALTVAGLLFIVWIKPIVLRREAERRAAAGLAKRAAKAKQAQRDTDGAEPEAAAVGEVTA
jgi:hypothetical protein